MDAVSFIADQDLPRPAPNWESRLTPFQRRCVEGIRLGRNGIADTTEIARRLRSSRVAVWNALVALRQRGIANYFRSGGHGQWDQRGSTAHWFVRADDMKLR